MFHNCSADFFFNGMSETFTAKCHAFVLARIYCAVVAEAAYPPGHEYQYLRNPNRMSERPTFSRRSE
jgi:hypothetical protein